MCRLKRWRVRNATPQDGGVSVSRRCCASRRAALQSSALRTRFRALHVICAADAGGSRSVDLEALRRKRAERPQPERPTPARAPSAPPRRQFYGPKATREQLQLNEDIRACASADAVLDLVSSQRAVLNEVNASTALTTIQRRAGKRAAWLQSDPRFAQLLSAAESLFELMGPQELANSLYACGQLSIMPPGDWLERFWHASASKLGDFDPQAFANTIYACGQLGLTPPVGWLERFWLASAPKFGDFIAQHFANTLYACGQLGLAPPTDWLQRFWHASAAKLGDFVPQALSNTIYACGQLRITPPADWLERFWLACDATLGAWIAQDYSITIYACGQLGITPTAYWLERFWHVSASKLGDFVPQALSNTLYACSQLGVTPPADWMGRFWLACDVTLGAWIAQDFSNTIYAGGLLGVTPPDDWLERFWHASAATLGDWIPQDFANTIYACGLLDIRPPADWLSRFSSGCEQALPGLTQQNLANTALTLTMLGLWELPLWRGLWARLCSSLARDIAGWSAEDRLHARQMYQAYQAAAVERPGLLPAPSPELLAAARKSWIDRVRDGEDNARAGMFHNAVSECLTRMGVAHANERWCERAERSIDIVIEVASPIALEVDGPWHFLQDGRLEGSTLLRNRMLAAHGWRVVVVDYRIWDVETQEQREQYLRGLLA